MGDPDSDTSELDRMHATNHTGVIAIIRVAAKVLRDNGRIITVSSGVATRVGVTGLADYAATKAGIEGDTKGVARDLGPRGITANVVQAGPMESGMTPLTARNGPGRRAAADRPPARRGRPPAGRASACGRTPTSTA